MKISSNTELKQLIIFGPQRMQSMMKGKNKQVGSLGCGNFYKYEQLNYTFAKPCC